MTPLKSSIIYSFVFEKHVLSKKTVNNKNYRENTIDLQSIRCNHESCYLLTCMWLLCVCAACKYINISIFLAFTSPCFSLAIIYIFIGGWATQHEQIFLSPSQQ